MPCLVLARVDALPAQLPGWNTIPVKRCDAVIDNLPHAGIGFAFIEFQKADGSVLCVVVMRVGEMREFPLSGLHYRPQQLEMIASAKFLNGINPGISLPT